MNIRSLKYVGCLGIWFDSTIWERDSVIVDSCRVFFCGLYVVRSCHIILFSFGMCIFYIWDIYIYTSNCMLCFFLFFGVVTRWVSKDMTRALASHKRKYGILKGGRPKGVDSYIFPYGFLWFLQVSSQTLRFPINPLRLDPHSIRKPIQKKVTSELIPFWIRMILRLEKGH